jgi:transposase
MVRMVLSDTQWGRIEDFLTGKSGDCGVTAKDNRLFVEVVLWGNRTGSPWRDLPEVSGHWHRVYVRYSRWGKNGTWERLFSSVPDAGMFDGRRQRCQGAPARRCQKKELEHEAIGKSLGGLCTEIHAAVDALGNPVRLC